MRFTNRSGLAKHTADVLEAAFLNDAYDAPQGEKVISVTTLIGPAQKRVLERSHATELQLDLLDTIPALLGQALHHILERAGSKAPTGIPEERLHTMYDGWTISGKSDLYETEDRTLIDYKNSSVWTYIFGKKEWEDQLNVLRWIRVRNGQPVKGLCVTLFCGDWRRSEAKRSPDYPARVVNIDIPMWSMDEATAYVDARLKLHQAAQEDQIPPCTDAERWAKPTSWAIMKEGRKTAIAVYGSEEDAAKDLKAGQFIVKRPGESVRCNGYCLARNWCVQAANDPTLKQEENDG